MPALDAVLLTFSFQFSLLFFNMSLIGRTRAISMALGCTSTAAYYWTISDNGRCRKFGYVPFWCAAYSSRERLK